MRLAFRTFSAVLILAAACVLVFALRQRSQAAESFTREVQSAAQEAQKIAHDVVLYTSARVGAGANFANSLQRMGLDAVTAADVTGSAGSVFNFRRFHAGNLLWIGRSVNGAVRAVKYQIDADRMLLIEAREAGYHTEIQQIPSRVQTLTVTGTVRDSLFGAVTDAGESRNWLCAWRKSSAGFGFLYRSAAWRHLPRGGRKERISRRQDCRIWTHPRRRI